MEELPNRTSKDFLIEDLKLELKIQKLHIQILKILNENSPNFHSNSPNSPNGDGVHPPETIQYPESLTAPDFRRGAPWNGGPGRGRRGGRSGRGRGGRGWTPTENKWETDDELMDTASSPVKINHGPTRSSSSSKRRLDLEGEHQKDATSDILLLESSEMVEKRTQGVHESGDEIQKMEEFGATSRDVKKQKMEGASNNSDLATSAGSLEEHRRA